MKINYSYKLTDSFHFISKLNLFKIFSLVVGPGGLQVMYQALDPRFACSNSAEVDGVFSGCKYPEFKLSGRDFKPWIPNLRYQAR